MQNRKVLPVVSAAVTPSIAEEIDRLTASSKRSRSEVVRTLLEERLTQREDERNSDRYEAIEKRLAKLEQRFSGLLVKTIRLSAQNYYVSMFHIREQTELEHDKYQKLQEKAKAFAGDVLKQGFEDKGSKA